MAGGSDDAAVRPAVSAATDRLQVVLRNARPRVDEGRGQLPGTGGADKTEDPSLDGRLRLVQDNSRRLGLLPPSGRRSLRGRPRPGRLPDGRSGRGGRRRYDSHRGTRRGASGQQGRREHTVREQAERERDAREPCLRVRDDGALSSCRTTWRRRRRAIVDDRRAGMCLPPRRLAKPRSVVVSQLGIDEHELRTDRLESSIGSWRAGHARRLRGIPALPCRPLGRASTWNLPRPSSSRRDRQAAGRA
jgi:hypothetical protein